MHSALKVFVTAVCIWCLHDGGITVHIQFLEECEPREVSAE